MLISVVIPVYNEKELINRNMVFLKKTTHNLQVEIIVVDGGSKDDTANLAARYADKVLVTHCKGRGMQMHQGALAANGKILLFLHIDTILPDNWVECLLFAWQECVPLPKATAFHLKFDDSGWQYNLICWAARVRYLLTGVPHGDQAIAIHRDTYFKCGGFPDVPFMEEYAIFKKIKEFGQIKWLPKDVITSVRRYKKHYPLIHALKNSVIVYLYYMGLSPNILSRFYH